MAATVVDPVILGSQAGEPVLWEAAVPVTPGFYVGFENPDGYLVDNRNGDTIIVVARPIFPAEVYSFTVHAQRDCNQRHGLIDRVYATGNSDLRAFGFWNRRQYNNQDDQLYITTDDPGPVLQLGFFRFSRRGWQR